MKLIKSSFEIWEQGNEGIPSIYKQIERAGRTCYKSEDKITDESSLPFVNRMIESQHYAMLEHGTVYLHLVSKDVSFYTTIKKYSNNKYSRVFIDDEGKNVYITTNLRVIVENNWRWDLQYLCTPTQYHIKRYTVHFICNRQVSHEFVRHRVFSFAQESTRYCNYTKGKFGGELTFIDPCWVTDTAPSPFLLVLKNIEFDYFQLINDYGWKPQEAATILPNSLKTELVMTGFEDDWVHFFDLRALGTTGAPHPQASELAKPLMEEFITRGYIKKL